MILDVHRNFIFVKPITEPGSKLILPPIYKKNLDTVQRGVVKACGPDSFVTPEETIVFDKWVNNEVILNGERLLIIQPHHVITVES
jgi:co-chaperonin GroES (HSP10)